MNSLMSSSSPTSADGGVRLKVKKSTIVWQCLRALAEDVHRRRGGEKEGVASCRPPFSLASPSPPLVANLTGPDERGGAIFGRGGKERHERTTRSSIESAVLSPPPRRRRRQRCDDTCATALDESATRCYSSTDCTDCRRNAGSEWADPHRRARGRRAGAVHREHAGVLGVRHEAAPLLRHEKATGGRGRRRRKPAGNKPAAPHPRPWPAPSQRRAKNGRPTFPRAQVWAGDHSLQSRYRRPRAAASKRGGGSGEQHAMAALATEAPPPRMATPPTGPEPMARMAMPEAPVNGGSGGSRRLRRHAENEWQWRVWQWRHQQWRRRR